jgi:hypothetical protein
MGARACVALWRSGLGEKKYDWSESEMCTGVRGHKGAQENCDTFTCRVSNHEITHQNDQARGRYILFYGWARGGHIPFQNQTRGRNIVIPDWIRGRHILFYDWTRGRNGSV